MGAKRALPTAGQAQSGAKQRCCAARMYVGKVSGRCREGRCGPGGRTGAPLCRYRCNRPQLGGAGIPWDDRLWDGTWAAVKRVWASKWGDRAAGGLRGAGVAPRDLQMAVLVQRVVPARYAFVAHTVHPTAGAQAPCTQCLGFRAAGSRAYPGHGARARHACRAHRAPDRTRTGSALPLFAGCL